MSKEDDKRPGKIDFSKFRVSISSTDLPIAEKVLLYVPTRKPSKQTFVRVHPDKQYNYDAALLKLESEEKPYLVSQSVVNAIAQDVKIVVLHLSIDRQGNIFLWPVPPIPLEGNENTWNQSQRQIAEMAKKQWVRLTSNMSIGCYEGIPAKGEIPDPTWPSLSLDEILNIAFGSSHIIDRLDHPALLKLWGSRLMYKQAKDLPFQDIYAIDFEFFGNDGDIPKIVCMVTQNIKTMEISRVWCDQLLEMKTPPFIMGENTLLITYFAPAEIQSMLALDWSTALSIIDLFVEFRCETNGNPNIFRKGLVNALSYYQLNHLIPEEKEEMRTLILSGGPWTNDQHQEILNYCEQDVVALSPLFDAILKQNPWNDLRLNQALLRGRYMNAVGSMQHRGIPIDLETLQNLDVSWEEIKIDLIETVNQDFGVYSDGVFKEVLFETYLAQQNIAWPRLDSGRLMLDKDTFSSMSKRYPKVQPLHELRKTLSEFKLNKLAVGKDGRNRTLLSPFAAKTGRNQPSTAKFIFGPAKWVRGLIKPEIGMSLAYCDWSSQEIAIAAALSGDELLWKAYESGDPYIAFAIQAGLAPPEATKETHKDIRNRCKSVVLGTNYGMSAYGVAQVAKIHLLEAKSLLQKHRETYKNSGLGLIIIKILDY